VATIGLDKLFYAPITEAPVTGEETYGTPVMLAKAISAELSIELAESTLWADDGPSEVVREFKGGKLTLGVDDIGLKVAEALTGATTDDDGVLISSSEDIGNPVAIGFRARKANGKFRYFWFYRVKFAVPSNSLATKGDTITFQTPKIEGTVMRRNKPDSHDRHPWKAEVTEGDQGVKPSVIEGWYTQVYEANYTT
jgi:phi13 family phage major tail protein